MTRGPARGWLALALWCACGWAQADLWVHVDERGVARWASSQLDSRYQLFARLAPEANPTSPSAHTAPLAPATPQATPKGVNPERIDRWHQLLGAGSALARFQADLETTAQRHGVDHRLLQALIAAESGFEPDAISPKGAVGLMQVMPDTARRFGVQGSRSQTVTNLLKQPALNLRTGTRYLAFLIKRFEGDLRLALAAYNAGEGAVDQAGRQVPNYPETQAYVHTVLQLYRLLKPEPPSQLPTAQPTEPVRHPVGVIPGRGNLPLGPAVAPAQPTP